MPITENIKQSLIQRALEVKQKAYAPYSHYHVGAALLTEQGEIFAGCNVENASYGLSICAERSAILQAVAGGKRNAEGQIAIQAMVIATDNLGSPCGACLQVISEFAPEPETMLIALVSEQGERREYPFAALFPHPFDRSKL